MNLQSQKMRADEAATYLRLAQSTLAKLRCYGGGPAFSKIGGRRIIYDRSDLDEWLASRLFRSTAEYPSRLSQRA